MPGLWRNDDDTRQGKYLVLRRDGTVLDCPYFVIAARDPAAPLALVAYAEAARDHGMDPAYVQDVLVLAGEFADYRDEHGPGDPDAPRHRTDDPATVERMPEPG